MGTVLPFGPSALGKVALLLAFTVFAIRGPVRAWRGSTDLVWGYLSSRAWALGENPYSVALCEGTAPLDLPPGLNLRGVPTPYAPGFFLPFCFYRWLGWQQAVIYNLVLSCLGIGFALWFVVRHLSLPKQRQLLMVSLVLLGYPLSTGIAHGQPSTMAVACALAVLGARLAKGKAWVTGLLAATSLLIKPQVGIACCLYLLLRRDLRALLLAGGFYSLVNGVAAGFMVAQGATLETFRGALEGLSRVSAQQADPYCCVNLHETHIPSWAQVVALVVPIGAYLASLWTGGSPSQTRGRAEVWRRTEEVRTYGIAVLVPLLAVYQRPYHLLLLCPLLWFVLRSAGSLQARWTVFGLLLPALQPVPLLPLARVIESRLVDPWGTVYHLLLRPIHSWFLLALLYLLVFAPRLLEPVEPVTSSAPS